MARARKRQKPKRPKTRTRRVNGHLLTRQQLAERFGVIPGTVTRWERDGCPVAKKQSRGRPSLFDAKAVTDWRDAVDTAKRASGASLEQERALLARAQRERTEMENLVRRGELVPRADVIRAGQAYTKAWLAKVRAWPKALLHAGLIKADQEATVALKCRELLEEIAGWDTLAEADAEATKAAS